MMFGNPAMLDPNSELIEYDGHKAILKKDGDQLNLQILVSGKHVLDASLDGGDEKMLFAVFDQAAVDKIASALSN
jgi:hypothetical protein